MTESTVARALTKFEMGLPPESIEEIINIGEIGLDLRVEGDSQGLLPAEYAIEKGKGALAAYLVHHNAPISSEFVLRTIESNTRSSMVALLDVVERHRKDHGTGNAPDWLNAKLDWDGRAAAHLLSDRETAEYFKSAVSAGMRLDRPDADGWHAAHYAAANNNVAALEIIAGAKGDNGLFQEDHMGRTPLFLAESSVASKTNEKGAAALFIAKTARDEGLDQTEWRKAPTRIEAPDAPGETLGLDYIGHVVAYVNGLVTDWRKGPTLRENLIPHAFTQEARARSRLPVITLVARIRDSFPAPSSTGPSSANMLKQIAERIESLGKDQFGLSHQRASTISALLRIAHAGRSGEHHKVLCEFIEKKDQAAVKTVIDQACEFGFDFKSSPPQDASEDPIAVAMKTEQWETVKMLMENGITITRPIAGQTDAPRAKRKKSLAP